MDVFWLSPVAWLGLVALALPVLIHLLTKRQTRQVLYPTLRFLRATRLAALGRRSLQDWPLLAVRLLVLAAAVAALAGPVFVSAARRAEWNTRVARAFVVVPGSAGFERVLQEERQTSVASAVFTPAVRASDGLRDAAAWLERQPPAAREIVIVGDLRHGALAEQDLAVASPGSGLRFLVVPPADPDRSVEVPVLHGRDHAIERLPVAVRAAAADQPFANAALLAVVARGIPLDIARNRRVLVIFEGAETGDLEVKQPADAIWMREALERLPETAGGQSGDTLVVYAKQPARGAMIPGLIDRVARAAFAEDLRNVETHRASPATLAAWSRPPSGIGDQGSGIRDQGSGIRHEGYEGQVRPADEGDRRWLWAVVLLLLGLEALIRRSRAPRRDAEVEEEARVA